MFGQEHIDRYIATGGAPEHAARPGDDHETTNDRTIPVVVLTRS